MKIIVIPAAYRVFVEDDTPLEQIEGIVKATVSASCVQPLVEFDKAELTRLIDYDGIPEYCGVDLSQISGGDLWVSDPGVGAVPEVIHDSGEITPLSWPKED